MTREEAIKHLLHDWHINLGCDFVIKPGRLDDFLAALDVALTALRPVSRERVEKLRGEWRSTHGLSEYYCSRCGEEFEIHAYDKDKYQFCPHCMAPMTGEAVKITLKRLEALHEAN